MIPDEEIEQTDKKYQFFKDLTGEDPADVLGGDWRNIMDDYLEMNGLTHEGHLVGNCFVCKDGI